MVFHELGDDLVVLNELGLELLDLAVLGLLDARGPSGPVLERPLGLVEDELDPVVTWTEKSGIATAPVSQWAKQARIPNPFAAKCFGSPNNAWARRMYLPLRVFWRSTRTARRGR